MPKRSHITNDLASGKVRTRRNDLAALMIYEAAMNRRGIPNAPSDWHLREWMDARQVRQADMCRRTGWSKATMSQLYNGVQDYSPKVVRAAADALGLEVFELFLLPDQAGTIRELRALASRLRSIETTH